MGQRISTDKHKNHYNREEKTERIALADINPVGRSRKEIWSVSMTAMVALLSACKKTKRKTVW